MKRNIIVLVLVIALIGIAIYQYRDDARLAAQLPEEQAPEVNFLAPHFSLDGIDGNHYAVNGEARDKALLLNFWASWCEPCHLEAPDLIKLHEKYGDRVDIYAINVTDWDTVPDAMAFVEQYGFEFPVLLDEDNEVSPLYKVRSYPTNILIDRNGVIVERFNWMLREGELKIVERHLKRM